MVSQEQSNQSAPVKGDLPQDRQVYTSNQGNTTAPTREQSISFSTEEGRKILFAVWLNRRLNEGKIDPQKLYIEEFTRNNPAGSIWQD